MARFVKILLWLVAAFVALFAIASVALYVFFDPNDFREDISAAVKNQTGRELTIEGDISLDLFPWLAVEVGKTRLGDAPGFGDEPFASFDRASFSVRLLPVIVRQEIIVGGATVEGLALNLKVDKKSVSNWSDLIPDDGAAEESSSESESAELDINRIDIENATVRYSNDESGEVYTLSDMNIHIGRLKSNGEPVPLDGDMRFAMTPTGLSGAVNLDTVLSYNSDNGILGLANLAVDGSVEGLASVPTEMRFSTDSIGVDTQKFQITMAPIDLALATLDIKADVAPFSYEERITPTAKLEIARFSPREVMTLFDVEPPVTADPSALGAVAMTADAALTTSSISLTNVVIQLDDTRFSGSLSVPRGAMGAYQFDLKGDSIDLNRYMEPTDGAAASGGSDAAVEIPADLIRPLNGRGQLVIEKATLGDIEFENITLGLNAKAGKLRLFPMSASLFGGTYSGDIRIDVAESMPTLAVNEKIADVDLAKLAMAMYKQDNVTGSISGAFTLNGRGTDMNAIRQSLAGNINFELTDGTYEGTDIWYEMRRARARLKGEEPPEPVLPARTSFSTVRASGAVANGVLKNDDLFAELPHMQITGSGSVNLALATVDYGLTARILERPEFLTNATPQELDEFTEAVIPLKITGPLASPSVKPDVEKLIRQRVEEEIKDRLEDKLKDLFR